jgi:arylsulfatase A-like enzyme
MSENNKPNILLIMTDQQRGDCLGVAGHPVLLTPSMDAIAHNGVRFTRAYSTCPSCIAARRSLLSGQFPKTHGMVGYHSGVEWQLPPTLPQVLRDNGYQTLMIGRSMHQYPQRRRMGFDQLIQQDEYLAWLEKNAPSDSGGWFGSGIMHNDWTVNPWPLAEHLHFTNWTVNTALEAFARRDPSCPLFMVVSFIAPHPPLQPPAFYMDRYLRTGGPDPIIGDWETPPDPNGQACDTVSPNSLALTGEALRSARAAYYGSINHVDDQIRRLLNPINGIPPQLHGNTVILFTADHGEMLGDHYRWRKQVPYESSANIPLLIQAPARFGIHPGRRVDQPVALEDIMPTLLDLAGCEIPATVEGRSLVPLLRGGKPAWRDYLTIEHAPEHQSLTDGREKFIWLVADGREQFFDLVADPGERHNLIADPRVADRVTLWRNRLIAELSGRPEGFTDGQQLIPGRPFSALLPGSPNTYRPSHIDPPY